MFRHTKTIAVLLIIILMVQAPLSLAFACADSASMAKQEMHMPLGDPAHMPKCHGESDNPTNVIDDEASCESNCCPALSAPILPDTVTMIPKLHVPLAAHCLSDRLINTYLKSENRPPIS